LVRLQGVDVTIAARAT